MARKTTSTTPASKAPRLDEIALAVRLLETAGEQLSQANANVGIARAGLVELLEIARGLAKHGAVLALFAFVLVGCGGAVDGAPAEPIASCARLTRNNTGAPELWQLMPTTSANPLPGVCEDWDNGMFYCPQSACLPEGYTGNCGSCADPDGGAR
ncbi:MAG: hypothetical protein WDO69_22710 [Pseudomonadota bacterium]